MAREVSSAKPANVPPSAAHPSDAAHLSQDAQPTTETMTLPTLVFGLVEVRRLHRELESLEAYLQQARIRAAGSQAPLPRLSRMLEVCASSNHLNLMQADDRQKLTTFLQAVAVTAPTIHISFAVDPSSGFTAKIVTWLREQVHPLALLQLGLQPSIAAGCIVRTNNKVFDFSLRQAFDAHRSMLVEAIGKDA